VPAVGGASGFARPDGRGLAFRAGRLTMEASVSQARPRRLRRSNRRPAWGPLAAGFRPSGGRGGRWRPPHKGSDGLVALCASGAGYRRGRLRGRPLSRRPRPAPAPSERRGADRCSARRRRRGPAQVGGRPRGGRERPFSVWDEPQARVFRPIAPLVCSAHELGLEACLRLREGLGARRALERGAAGQGLRTAARAVQVRGCGAACHARGGGPGSRMPRVARAQRARMARTPRAGWARRARRRGRGIGRRRVVAALRLAPPQPPRGTTR
jgi:hypothetical protein